jgi:hypothetical protein
MQRRLFILLAPASALASASSRGTDLLGLAPLRTHVEKFNAMLPEEVVNEIPDARAAAWMESNIPLFACPDPAFEELYFYRWWAFRKHIKRTPAGAFIVDEFLKPVGHASDSNAISCAFGHHVAEGRWLRDRRYISDYAAFWLRGGADGGLQRHFHQFSGWASAALYGRYLADGDSAWLTTQLQPLIADYRAWERDRLLPSGLFWQRDVSDGMEESASGGRRVKHVRPSINSYMYGNARALSLIASMAGNSVMAAEYEGKAATLRRLVEEKLWNPDARFFETLDERGAFVPVRESIGFTPWYFDLPQPGRGYEDAWKQLIDPQGFFAPYGPTTAERRSPLFRIANTGDDCQWNGPSWPFATTITLRALANLLNTPGAAPVISKQDYFRTFQIYARSQHLTTADGRVIPFIDENLNPLTGQWQARSMKIAKRKFNGRGDHYNHSAFADLVITGLAGLRPATGNLVTVNPLLPERTWDWFALDRLPYHGRLLSIVWDRTGARFHRGKGLTIFADGRRIAHAPRLGPLVGHLPT